MSIKNQSSLKQNLFLHASIVTCFILFYSIFQYIMHDKVNAVYADIKKDIIRNRLFSYKKNYTDKKHNASNKSEDFNYKKQNLRAISTDQSVDLWSNAFNFSKIWGTQVDPRTGTLSFHVKVGSLLSNFGHGPDIDLEINYNSNATTDPDSIGHGWSWNLTHFNLLTNQLTTSSGQSLYLKQEGSGKWHPQYHKLKDILITGNKNDHFAITYANGLRETLDHAGYEVRLEQQDGHCVHFSYAENSHRLQAITDDEGHKIIIKQQNNYLIITSYDSEGKGVDVQIDHSAGKLNAVSLPLRDNLNWAGIHIYYLNNLITRIAYPTGLKEELTYNCKNAMKLPLHGQSASGSMCVISGEIMDPGAGQPPVKTDYTYSQINTNGHNYLGFNSGLNFVNGSQRDILFDAPVDYTYHTLQGNSIIKEIRTYNKYHLLINDRKTDTQTGHILSEVKNFYCRTNKENGCADSSFENLPVTYSLPLKTVTKVWGESDETPSTTTETSTYDNYGRVISHSDSYGRTTKTVYCPIQGNTTCPAAPSGWLFNALPLSVTTYPANKGDGSSLLLPVTVYSYYRKLTNLNGKGYIPILDHQVYQAGNKRRVITRRYYDQKNTFSYGLLRQTTLTSTESIHDSLKSVVKNYYYIKSNDGKRKTTYSTIALGHGKLQLSPSITTSLFTNQRLESVDAEKKNRMRYHYDHWGRLIQTDFAIGTPFTTHTSYQYVVSSQLNEVLIISANGLQNNVVFDGAGRKVAAFREAVTTTGKAEKNHWLPTYKISYDSNGRIAKKTAFWFGLSGEKHTWTTTLNYDYAGRIRRVFRPDGETDIAFYDDQNRCQVSYRKNSQGEYSVISIIHANELDKPKQEIILPVPKKSFPPIKKLCSITSKQPDAKVTTTIYDGFGRAVTTIDASGKTVSKRYDVWGQGIDIINPTGDRTHVTYNLTGQVIKQQIFPVAGGHYVLSSAEYNAAGQLLWQSGEDGRRTYYTYTTNGNLNSTTLKTGHTLSWQYNLLGLPTLQILDGKVSLQTTYDFTTALPLKKEDNTGTSNYIYSDDGLIQQIIHHGKNNYPDYKLQWVYDQNRRIISVTDISGNRTISKYDDFGRIEVIVYQCKDSQETDAIYKPVYDGFSRIVASHYGSGMQRTLRYDNYERVYQIKDTLNEVLLSQRNYSYDINNNITTIVQLAGKNETGILHYHYDAHNNLISMTCHGSSALPLCPRDTDFSGSGLRNAPVIVHQEYAFTPLNHLAQVRETLQNQDQQQTLRKITRYTYGNNDAPLRLRTISTQWNNNTNSTSSFIYDAAGNMIRDGEGNQITYNAFSQITRVTTTVGTQSYYTYDGSGKEIEEKNTKDTRYLIYRGNLINEKIVTADKISHIMGYQGVARTIDGVIKQYYESNYKGDIIGILTKDQQNIHQYRLSRRNVYSPYGMIWYKSNDIIPSYQQPELGFDGEHTDPATGWQFLGAGHRTYNPKQRYFVSEDPAGDGYRFCSNNPVMATDPDGNTPKWMEMASRVMGYIGTLGFSAVPKKWARITGSAVALGMTVAITGLMAASDGVGALLGAISLNAAIGSLPVITAAVPPNKGLNMAAEITGGLMVATTVVAGLAKLGFTAFSAITTKTSVNTGIELTTVSESFAPEGENETSFMEGGNAISSELSTDSVLPINGVTQQGYPDMDLFVIDATKDLQQSIQMNFYGSRTECSFYDALVMTSFFYSDALSSETSAEAFETSGFFLRNDLRNITFDEYKSQMFSTFILDARRMFMIENKEIRNAASMYHPLNYGDFIRLHSPMIKDMMKRDITPFYKNVAIFRRRINYYGPVLTGSSADAILLNYESSRYYHPSFIKFVRQNFPGGFM